MNFLSIWFHPSLLLAAHVILAILLLVTAKAAAASLRLHPTAAIAASLVLATLWGLHIELGDGQLTGMNYHLLGISLITLMLGAPAALWLSVIMLLPYTVLLHGAENLPVASLNTLFLLMPSIIINVALRQLSFKLPTHLFVYIFLNGFIATILSMFTTGSLLMWLLQTAEVYPAHVLWESAFPVFLLLAWGEAFLTGLLISIFVALKPQLLATFDDVRYLQAKNQIWKP